MSEQRFHESLRSELIRAAGDEYPPSSFHRPKRWWALGAAAVLLLAVVLAALAFRSEDDLSADSPIIVDGNDLILRVEGIGASREEIEEAAASFGVDITTEDVPVGPSMVGAFVGVVASELPPQLLPMEGQPYRLRGVRIPGDWEGSLVLKFGREARPGEPWYAPSDAQADGEPLECMHLIGEMVADVKAALSERDLTVRWFAVGNTIAEFPQSDTSAIDSWRVTRLQAVSPSEVIVDATEDGAWLAPSAEEGGIPQPTNPDC